MHKIRNEPGPLNLAHSGKSRQVQQGPRLKIQRNEYPLLPPRSFADGLDDHPHVAFNLYRRAHAERISSVALSHVIEKGEQVD